MLTMRPSISSDSSFLSSSSSTLWRTAASGSKILLRENIRQKSFFGVGPWSSKTHQIPLTPISTRLCDVS
jgi:hypothetical protein